MKGLELRLAVLRTASIMTTIFMAGQPWASYQSPAPKLCPDQLEAQLSPKDHQGSTLDQVNLSSVSTGQQ